MTMIAIHRNLLAIIRKRNKDGENLSQLSVLLPLNKLLLVIVDFYGLRNVSSTKCR